MQAGVPELMVCCVDISVMVMVCCVDIGVLFTWVYGKTIISHSPTSPCLGK